MQFVKYKPIIDKYNLISWGIYIENLIDLKTNNYTNLCLFMFHFLSNCGVMFES